MRKISINWPSKVWMAFHYDTKALGAFLRTKPVLTDKDFADLADIVDGNIRRKKGRRPQSNPRLEWRHKLRLALIECEEKYKKAGEKAFRQKARQWLGKVLMALKEDETGKPQFTRREVDDLIKEIEGGIRREKQGGPKPAR